jgi:type I restriction-modification system DNA methylase subunit
VTVAEIENASAFFWAALQRMRIADRFAVGRRVLALVALAALQPDRDLARRQLRAYAHGTGEGDPRRPLHAWARVAEAEISTLRGVFTDVLVNDTLHSRNFNETAVLASIILSELPSAVGEGSFGRWFSERLNDLTRAGPVVGDLATSEPIAQLMLAVSDPQAGQSVYDPCCGLGGLLAAALATAPDVRLRGHDSHPVSWAFTRLRLTLLGAQAEVKQVDSLEMAQSPGEFDVILCDPPLGAATPRAAGVDLFGSDAPTSGGRRLETLFVEHCAAELRPESKAVVLVSQAFLSRRGFDERLRSGLARVGMLEAVIALPAGISAGIYVDLAMIVLTGAAQSRPSVRMIDAQQVLTRRTRSRLPQEPLEILRQAHRGSGVTAFSRDVDRRELVAKDEFRPARLFVQPQRRPSVLDLLAEADAHDKEARLQSEVIDALLTELKLKRTPRRAARPARGHD